MNYAKVTFNHMSSIREVSVIPKSQRNHFTLLPTNQQWSLKLAGVSLDKACSCMYEDVSTIHHFNLVLKIPPRHSPVCSTTIHLYPKYRIIPPSFVRASSNTPDNRPYRLGMLGEFVSFVSSQLNTLSCNVCAFGFRSDYSLLPIKY